MPGIPTGSFLGQELHRANGTQRWVKAAEPAVTIFDEMVEQFTPALLLPLRVEEIQSLLNSSKNYWPHAYALCVMSAEGGDKDEAERYFEFFLADTADKNYPWVELRRRELNDCRGLMNTPLELEKRLAAIEAKKLQALKWDKKS